MVESEGAKKAIQDPNPVIDGRKANVNLAYLGAKPRTSAAAGIFSLNFTNTVARTLNKAR